MPSNFAFLQPEFPDLYESEGGRRRVTLCTITGLNFRQRDDGACAKKRGRAEPNGTTGTLHDHLTLDKTQSGFRAGLDSLLATAPKREKRCNSRADKRQ